MYSSSGLSYKSIFRFWIPLAATWLMMSAEGPFLTAIIARMAEPKFNLAAYGVAYSFALIIEAPVIMMMSASTALVKDYFSYKKLKKFAYFLNTLLTIIMLLFAIPDIFYFITIEMIELPVKVAGLTHISLIILIPWPAAIGYRRFYQGILIRNNQTKKVAYGTFIRLFFMTLTGIVFYFFLKVDGALAGASALSIGVISEAAASKLMVKKTIKKFEENKNGNEQSKINYKEIFNFYYPLALTSLITLGVHPLVTFFMGQSRMSIESLAVLPVINSFVFIFRSLGLSYQEVVIALSGEKKEEYLPLKNFAFYLGISVVSVLGIIALTPLSEIWYYHVAGLSQELTNFAQPPTIILAVMPGLTILIAFQRAVLIGAGRTKPITIATSIEFFGIISILFLSINFFNAVGVIAAAIAFLTGRLLANSYLSVPYLKTVKSYNQIKT